MRLRGERIASCATRRVSQEARKCLPIMLVGKTIPASSATSLRRSRNSAGNRLESKKEKHRERDYP